MRTKQFLKKGQERKTASILLREIIESLHQLFCCVPYFIAFVLFNSEEIIFPYLAGVLNILWSQFVGLLWDSINVWGGSFIIQEVCLLLVSIDPILFVCSIPGIAGIFLLFIPNNSYAFIRSFVLVSAVSTCFVSQYLLVTTSHVIGSLVPSIYPWILGVQNQAQLVFSFSTGVDGISLFFLLLTTLVFPFCFLSIYKKIKGLKFYCFCLLFLEAFLLFAFGVSDLLFFFFLFESVLIPMFFIIGIWGSGYQRIRAAYYFFFFTLAGSVFSLIAIFVVFTVNGSTLFYIILNSGYLNWQVELLFFFFFFGFRFCS